MNLTTILLLAAALQVAAKSNAQTVTYSAKSVSVEQAFAALEQQTGYVFFYREEDLSRLPEISVSLRETPIESALQQILKGLPLRYSIQGKMIVITKAAVPAPTEKEAKQQPPIDVHGRVVNEKGEPVAGASVVVKGTKRGVMADDNGEFTINANDGEVLIVSSVGYRPQEVRVTGSNIAVVLKVSDSPLDDIQVIAYGTTSRRLSTGNIGTVKAEDIAKQPLNNPLLALQARVPGLFITQISGITGGAVNVRVQGQNSIRSGNDPLYVIDGVPIVSQLPNISLSVTLGSSSGGVGVSSPLFYINPNDIESMDILKDADATAIYGSRAANGAILITTKKGSAGTMKLNVNIQYGLGKVARKMEMLNTRQYLDMRYEAFANDNIDWRQPNVSANDLKVWDTTRYTDWQKELIGGTAQYSDINASISGGTSALQYMIGGTFHRETTVFPGNLDDKRGSVNFNLNATSPNRKFRLQFSGNFMADNNRLPNSNLTQRAILLAPNAPQLYNEDGTLNWALNSSGVSTWENPLIHVLYKIYTNKTNNLVSNAIFGYTVLPGIEFKSSFGYYNTRSDEFQPVSLISIRPDRRSALPREAYFGSMNINSWIIEPQITIKRDISQGLLEGLMGMTFQKNTNNTSLLAASGFNSDLLLEDIFSATTLRTSNASSSVYKYNAIFGRLNYTWQHKYILNFNLRRDGSSRFGNNKKFNSFGSIGTAWIFSEEDFMNNLTSILSFAKLRASYGTTGNDQISDYVYISTYSSTSAGVPYQGITGLQNSRISNPNIQWEATQKLQAGIELGFWHDRVFVSATYAQNRSSNQIISYILPSVAGFNSIPYYNFPATVQNTNWEFMLNTENFKTPNFNWSSNFNLTIPRNKIIRFPNIEESSYASGNAGVIIGQPLGITKVFHYLRVDPVTGQYLVADKDGNPTSSPNFSADNTELVSTLPIFYGGFQNNISCKGFQLDFLFQFVKQIGLDYPNYYNGINGPGVFNTIGTSNQPAGVLNRWQKNGDITVVQKYSTSTFSNILPVSGDIGYSDAASFIRLKSLSLSWQLPTEWKQSLKMHQARIYLQGQNLITFTSFKGLDPEVQGISASLPPLRVITVGVQAGF